MLLLTRSSSIKHKKYSVYQMAWDTGKYSDAVCSEQMRVFIQMRVGLQVVSYIEITLKFIYNTLYLPYNFFSL